jgi:hypothetical protein
MALFQKAITHSGPDEPTTTKDSTFHQKSIPEDRQVINSTSIMPQSLTRTQFNADSFFWLGLICAGSNLAVFSTIL